MHAHCILASMLLCAGSQPTRFVLPCAGYAKAVETRASFGAHVTAANSPFRNSWHLAEDVWLPGGTEVRAIADGVVRYSAFSPTWTDARGATHWNLGNVIVVEHELEPPEKGTAQVCSFYVHLASDRRVQAGARVQRGDVLGRIGRGESEENGRYPAHLHFGIHLGPYLQVPPAFERELRAAARSKDGLRIGTEVLHGELELERNGVSDLLVRSRAERKACLLSLLVGSTAPKDPPPDIALWCQGYGEEAVLEEWLRPSSFLVARGAK
jgi:murein DD-endopeptidase MepM/ murein hydrolase activator NlpD